MELNKNNYLPTRLLQHDHSAIRRTYRHETKMADEKLREQHGFVETETLATAIHSEEEGRREHVGQTEDHLYRNG